MLSRRITPFGGVLATSILTGLVACNQALTIMLTHQLCRGVEEDGETLASYLEDTAVVVAPLVPWSIAGGVPLAAVSAPMTSLLAAWYLYLIPLVGLARAFRNGKNQPKKTAKRRRTKIDGRCAHNGIKKDLTNEAGNGIV